MSISLVSSFVSVFEMQLSKRTVNDMRDCMITGCHWVREIG